MAIRSDTLWSSPQTRFKTHVEDKNAARKTLFSVSSAFLWSICESGSGHVLRIETIVCRCRRRREL